MKTSIHPAAFQLWASYRLIRAQGYLLESSGCGQCLRGLWEHKVLAQIPPKWTLTKKHKTEYTPELACFPRALFMPSGFNQGWITPSSFN